MSNWLHIGSSPSVLQTLPQALAEHDFDMVMTCNAGIKLYANPDILLLCDGVASVNYAEYARIAQMSGTRLVTLKRECQKAVSDRKIGHFDEFLELPPVEKPFDGKAFTAFRFSGPLCLQYAILGGATQIVLVGCDGWTGENDYFDSDEGHHVQNCHGDIYERSTMKILRPQFRQMADVCPDVRFIQYGEPTFTIDSPNWEYR